MEYQDIRMGERSNFQKSWTLEFQMSKFALCLQNINIFSLYCQLSLEKLKVNVRCYYNLLNSAFWGWLSVESQPRNSEFRNNPENFHPCIRFLDNTFWEWFCLKSPPQSLEIKLGLICQLLIHMKYQTFSVKIRKVWTSSSDFGIYRDFHKPIWGRKTAPSQFKKEQKLPKILYIIPNFLVLHFGENFVKIRSKIPVTDAWKLA